MTEWLKSSHSGGDGNCVEIAWRKSSYTGSNGNCVEVAWPAEHVAVRDSKQPAGPTIAFPTTTWQAFVNDVLH